MLYTSESTIQNDIQRETCSECLQNVSQTFNETQYYNNTWTHNGVACVFETPSEDFITSPLFQMCVYFMYSAVFVVALLGNGLVCFVVHTSPRMKTVTNYFIVNLAVGDILMTLFCIPFSFVSMLVLRYWPFGGVMCKVVNYSQAVSVLVSAYTLLAISIDRYMAIMRPLKPRLGKAAAKLVVATVWGGALATAAPIPIVSQLQRPSPWHEVCEVDICGEQWENKEQSEQYTCALLALQFALPFCALVCTYARIAHAVWGGRPPGEAQSARDSRMQRSKRKMIKMMVTVVAVFTICWLPLNIFIVLWTTHESDADWGTWPGMPYVWFASHWLAMSHSCYNPIIYCYMNARYRRGFKQVLAGLMCLKFNESARSCHRSSICEGVPLSEMVGMNGSAAPRRSACKCRLARAGCNGLSNGNSNKACPSCNSLRQLKLMSPATVSRAPPPPARALSTTSTRHAPGKHDREANRHTHEVARLVYEAHAVVPGKAGHHAVATHPHQGGGGVDVEVTTGPSSGQTVPTVIPEAEQQELPLPASIEVLLGENGIPAASNSTNIHEGLARRWAAILQSGLSPEIKSTLIKKQSPPPNCSLLIPPKLNEEVAAAMNDSGIKRDKRIGEQQVVLAAAIATIGKVLNQMILTEDEQHVEALSDSSRLLCDLYHENSVTRRSLILPGLNKDMKELMEQTPISEYLFGDKLQDKVNAIKAVKKSGLELKNTPAQSKPPAKLVKNLNYRGPQRPQMLRPSGPKVKPKRPTYPATKTSTRPRRSPPRQYYHHRRQDHRRR